MDINSILNRDLSTIKDMGNRTYWFVRTDSGEYYDTYFNNNFFAIGWNEITLSDLRNIDVYAPTIRRKIRNNPDNGIDHVRKPHSQEAKITGILNKNRTFSELNRGDIVIMPSAGSNFLAFGIIEDEAPYTATDHNCPYLKRRRVNWIKSENSYYLDAKFNYIKKSFHAISQIDEKYHDVIDNFMFSSYTKGGYGNISLKLKISDDINYGNLKELIDNLIDIAREYNIANNIDENLEDVTIKLNLQSPGFVNLKNVGNGLIFAIAIALASCRPDDSPEKRTADDIIQQMGTDSAKIDSTKRLLAEFEVETN